MPAAGEVRRLVQLEADAVADEADALLGGAHEVLGVPCLGRDLEPELVERRGRGAGDEQGDALGEDRAAQLERCEQLGVGLAEKERARLVRGIALAQPGDVDADRVPSLQPTARDPATLRG